MTSRVTIRTSREYGQKYSQIQYSFRDKWVNDDIHGSRERPEDTLPKSGQIRQMIHFKVLVPSFKTSGILLLPGTQQTGLFTPVVYISSLKEGKPIIPGQVTSTTFEFKWP